MSDTRQQSGSPPRDQKSRPRALERRTARARPENSRLDEQTARLLWDEFKLIQDKIDRIGDFHFRVRTWAITLSTALVAGGLAKSVSWYTYLLALPLISTFHLIDRTQSYWEEAMVGRAAVIERMLRRSHRLAPRLVQFLRRKKNDIRETRLGVLILRRDQIFYALMYLLVLTVTGISAYSMREAVLP